MSIIRRRNHEVPSLNTASLPDLIFAILFFFMIVTHMRKVNLKVRYKTPQGTELNHLSPPTSLSASPSARRRPPTRRSPSD